MRWPSCVTPTKGWSLRHQLVAWVLLPQLVLWGAGGAATYRLAVSYVNEAADAALLQAARTLARQVKPMGNGLLIDFPRAAQNVLEADPDDRFLYTVSTPPGRFILGNNNIPQPPAHMTPNPNEPWFYDGELVPSEADAASVSSKVRVAALFLKYGEVDGRQQWMLVQVARGVAARQGIWKRILVDTLLPLSALIFLMTVIVWAGTGAGLAPLLRLRREVEGRAPNDLTPLRAEAAPHELRSLVRALNDLLAKVRQNVDAQMRFIADAAHQLRTPLAGVISHVELALGATDDPALIARLNLVHQSATRSAHLIGRMLMLARTEPEVAEVQERLPVELRALVEQVVAEMVPKALRAGADLGVGRSSAQDDLAGLWVLSDPMLLTEALANILDNAIEYAGSGSEITVDVERDGAQARVSVSDNGPGIAPADKSRVFDRFVRGTDRGQGCGLGLAIVQEVVLRHGGRVDLHDVQPHGLQVIVILPLL